jgi:hypothetical protein
LWRRVAMELVFQILDVLLMKSGRLALPRRVSS